MFRRGWLWAATVADLLLLAIAFYMAISAAMVAQQAGQSFFAVAVAALFFALPVFCIFAPLAAFRAARLRRSTAQIVSVLAAPWIYAVFLLVFLFTS